MYEIILFTWYQENPNDIYEEVYDNLGFESLQETCEFLGKHSEKIIDEFPVTSISIKYNAERNLNNHSNKQNIDI